MFKKAFFIFCLFSIHFGIAQDLYVPRDIKQAYNNGTRTMDGKPGKNYWQNHGIYSIKLQVSPPDCKVIGQEEITYMNNSPDTLKTLNFKLILNNHKPGAARYGQANEAYLRSGTHILSYTENGIKKEWVDENDGTNKRIQLTRPLAPDGEVKLKIDWDFEVSRKSGREGAIDSTTFFLAYFYPRIAVYDDYEGWDTMTFTGAQEFYNDFNDYTVQVSVPKNYVVWATGDLQNPKEVLKQPYLGRLEKSMTSDSIIRIATPADLAKKQITVQNETNTWRWKAHNITDFAIAISNHYNWDASSVTVDSKTGRRASVQAAYDSVSKDFEHMVGFGNHALDWFSNKYPGIPYPFSKSTIVRGFADMEYPMMVNDNSTTDLDFTRFVVEHEIAHTYFPFYMGINETRFGFMDEGWATTLEYLISIDDLGQQQATKNFKRFRVAYWINSPNMEGDLPVITPTNALFGIGMGINEYGKAALGYLALKDFLGDKGFKTAIQGYMERWHGKHPNPWDFFYSINDVSGQNLNWLWNRWFFSNDYIDLGLDKVSMQGNNTVIHLKNIGGMPAPVDIIITMEDGKEITYHQTPALWKNNGKTAMVLLKGVKNAVRVQLDGGIFMDADLSDNTWNAKQ